MLQTPSQVYEEWEEHTQTNFFMSFSKYFLIYWNIFRMIWKKLQPYTGRDITGWNMFYCHEGKLVKWLRFWFIYIKNDHMRFVFHLWFLLRKSRNQNILRPKTSWKPCWSFKTPVSNYFLQPFSRNLQLTKDQQVLRSSLICSDYFCWVVDAGVGSQGCTTLCFMLLLGTNSASAWTSTTTSWRSFVIFAAETRSGLKAAVQLHLSFIRRGQNPVLGSYYPAYTGCISALMAEMPHQQVIQLCRGLLTKH